MAVKSFDELSDNNQTRLLEISMFLKIAQGVSDAEKRALAELMELFQTPGEWRRYRKDLFEKANEIRERMGLRRLGV